MKQWVYAYPTLPWKLSNEVYKQDRTCWKKLCFFIRLTGAVTTPTFLTDNSFFRFSSYKVHFPKETLDQNGYADLNALAQYHTHLLDSFT